MHVLHQMSAVCKRWSAHKRQTCQYDIVYATKSRFQTVELSLNHLALWPSKTFTCFCEWLTFKSFVYNPPIESNI